MNAYLHALKNYFNFSGRAGRREYWTFVLVNLLLGYVILFADRQTAIGDVPAALFLLLILIPTLAVSVRRLHDSDLSGWWVLLAAIPLVGPLVLIYFKCRTGNKMANRFGICPQC